MTLRTYQLRVRSADDSLRLEKRKARRLKAGELGGDTRCKEPEVGETVEGKNQKAGEPGGQWEAWRLGV